MTLFHGGGPPRCVPIGGWSWLVIFVIALGCRPSTQGPTRYSIKGSVSFRGQPVPIGRIVFEPDAKAGKDGPPAVAEVLNGRYETGLRFGGVGGPHIVVIEGFDSPGPGGLGPDDAAKPLFPEYRTTVELPREGSTQDFDVPEHHGLKKLKP
jgi:hypothetical protein